MKIIFMGTPDFAVTALLALLPRYKVVAIFTAMPKPAGRDMLVTKSPVQQVAEENNIEVYTPKTLRNKEIQEEINNIEADLIVVAAYGLIIPNEVLDAKKYGCINIHPSLLPKFRGAMPLQHTILSGDKETGVCIIKMDDGVDTGDIIDEVKFSINNGITLPKLSKEASIEGAKLLIKVIKNIDNWKLVKQNSLDRKESYARKLSRSDSNIDWVEEAISIDRKIRALQPWPSTFFSYKNNPIKILKAKYIKKTHNIPAGTVIDDKLTIACGKDYIQLLHLQRPGKKILSNTEFLKGYNIPSNTILQ